MPEPEYAIVGLIRKAQGIRGEVVVEPFTDKPDVMFASGSATATVSVVPLADTVPVVEGAESVILTVVDGAGYTAGAPATAFVLIAG